MKFKEIAQAGRPKIYEGKRLLFKFNDPIFYIFSGRVYLGSVFREKGKWQAISPLINHGNLNEVEGYKNLTKLKKEVEQFCIMLNERDVEKQFEKSSSLTEDEEYMFNLAVKLIIDYIRNKKGWNYSGYQAFFKDELIKDLQRECEFYPGLAERKLPYEPQEKGKDEITNYFSHNKEVLRMAEEREDFNEFIERLTKSAKGFKRSMWGEFDGMFYVALKNGEVQGFVTRDMALSFIRSSE